MATIQDVNLGTPTYGWYQVIEAQFNAGESTGLIAEVGVHQTGTGNNMLTRAVITPIDKAAENVLSVYYRMNCTPPLEM